MSLQTTELTARRVPPGVACDARGLPRWPIALALLSLSLAALTFADVLRSFETAVSAHLIEWVTGDQVEAIPATSAMVLHSEPSTQTMLVLSLECSIVYLLGALIATTTPMVLLRRLSVTHVLMAIGVASAVLVSFNELRLVTIGLAVGNTSSANLFLITHTYLGSVLTLVGTGLAALAFALVLLRAASRADRRGSQEVLS